MLLLSVRSWPQYDCGVASFSHLPPRPVVPLFELERLAFPAIGLAVCQAECAVNVAPAVSGSCAPPNSSSSSRSRALPISQTRSSGDRDQNPQCTGYNEYSEG
jgi:hypothetical protein